MAAETLVPAYVGLGSNLDGPAAQVRGAFEALAGLPRVRLIAHSALYRNPPMGPPGQPDYINAAAGILTSLPAAELLAALQSIEHAQGRRRGGPRWGPRSLDLDLLLYGNLQLESVELTLPHPGLKDRPFVLIPLLEIAPELRLPCGTSIAKLAAATRTGGLERLGA